MPEPTSSSLSPACRPSGWNNFTWILSGRMWLDVVSTWESRICTKNYPRMNNCTYTKNYPRINPLARRNIQEWIHLHEELPKNKSTCTKAQGPRIHFQVFNALTSVPNSSTSPEKTSVSCNVMLQLFSWFALQSSLDLRTTWKGCSRWSLTWVPFELFVSSRKNLDSL